MAVFLLGAIALVVPSGYSAGAALLLLGSGWLLVARPSLGLTRQDWLVIAALVGYAAVGMVEAWLDGQGSSGFDKPLRFLLAVPAMLLVMAYPPRLAWMWSGIAIGAIGAGSWASWQKWQGVERADSFTHVIQFGNLCMVLAVFCLAGLGWAWQQRQRSGWVALLLVGALGGILGSLFSGSRGGWIGFPIVLLVLYRGYGRLLPRRVKVSILVSVVLAAAAVYSIPQTGVQSRIHQGFEDVAEYRAGVQKGSSVGDRFEMWKGAVTLIQERPLTGWGSNGYHAALIELGEAGEIREGVTRFGHAHNEYLDAMAKRGVIGLAVLLMLYLVPMRQFLKQFGHQSLETRSVAIAGALLSVTYLDFGLTQTFMEHNSGVMMFAFWLAVLWGVFSSRVHREAAFSSSISSR
ncbi:MULTISPECIES: O-antigen ligase family protein [unclassified Halomonas]|uniref:O-antigen ligase family protein n=1 Tax=unclassified Halomonas TaxID=2609666 RepID=UPI001F22AE9D|nr:MULTISPECIES: O-antigen ligase family protein [unclassified Halomonas]